MAKLRVAPELLVECLFKGAAPDVRVVGASFDEGRQVLVLDIEGPGVPEAEHINAICSVERFAVRFEQAI